MEVLALQVRLTEADLMTLALKGGLTEDSPVEDLTLRIGPEGIVVDGYYPLFIRVRFETRWSIAVDQGMICARLTDLKALGVPASIFRSAVLKIIQDLGKAGPWLSVQGEQIRIDADQLLTTLACPTKTNLRAIRLEPGALVLEAAKPAPA